MMLDWNGVTGKRGSWLVCCCSSSCCRSQLSVLVVLVCGAADGTGENPAMASMGWAGGLG